MISSSQPFNREPGDRRLPPKSPSEDSASGDPSSEYRAEGPASVRSGDINPGTFTIETLRVYRLSGEDAIEWLQGQVTNDLRSLEIGGSIRGLLCRPKGTIGAVLEIWREADGLLLIVPEAQSGFLRESVEEFVIVEDVELGETDLHLTHVFGTVAPQAALSRPRNRVGVPGWDLLGAATSEPTITPDVWDALTLAAGEPEIGVDLDSSTLPAEMGPVFEAATVSYTKGCYTGQEILMRMHSRKSVAQIWHGVLLTEPMERGEELFDEEGKAVAKVTRAAVHPELGAIAGVMVRRTGLDRALFRRSADGERIPVEVRPMPLISS